MSFVCASIDKVNCLTIKEMCVISAIICGVLKIYSMDL